jgi:hypothetical protein
LSRKKANKRRKLVLTPVFANWLDREAKSSTGLPVMIQTHGQTPNSEMSATIEKAREETRAEMVVKSSAGWFLFVAAISLTNIILYLFDVHIRFFIRLWGGLGLGATELLLAASARGIGIGLILALIIAGVIVAVFFAIWNFARKGNKWAFWLGAGLYAVDGLLILLFFESPLGNLAFHAFALFWMLQGVGAISRLRVQEA